MRVEACLYELHQYVIYRDRLIEDVQRLMFVVNGTAGLSRLGNFILIMFKPFSYLAAG